MTLNNYEIQCCTMESELRRIGLRVLKETLTEPPRGLKTAIGQYCYYDIAHALSKVEPEAQQLFLERVLERAEFPNHQEISKYLVRINTLTPNPTQYTQAEKEERISRCGKSVGLRTSNFEITDSNKGLTRARYNSATLQLVSSIQRRNAVTGNTTYAYKRILGSAIGAAGYIDTSNRELFRVSLELGGSILLAKREQSEHLNPGKRILDLHEAGLQVVGMTSRGEPKGKRKLLLYSPPISQAA